MDDAELEQVRALLSPTHLSPVSLIQKIDPQGSPRAAQVARGRPRRQRRRPRRPRKQPTRPRTPETVCFPPRLYNSTNTSEFILCLTGIYLRRQQDEARQQILNQILQPEAADRLGRIRLVKEERASEIENRLIQLAQSGQLRQKVTEDQLKDLLNALSDKQETEKIVVNRRKGWDDDDDDLLDL